MQWLRCSEDGTCQRGALPGVALGALAVEAMVLQLVGLLEVVCVESDYRQVYLLEGQVVVAPELLQVVVEGHLALDSAWAHHPRHYLATWTTCGPCLLASPAVQCSKSGRVTNAKAKIQI